MAVIKLKKKPNQTAHIHADETELDTMYPRPRGYCGKGHVDVYYWRDDRPRRAQLANLYYLNKTYGIRASWDASIMVAGRPFSHYISYFNGNYFKRSIPESEWWAAATDNHTESMNGLYHYASVVQYLGSSHEIQYCAAAAGIPYDVVGIIEFLILAIV